MRLHVNGMYGLGDNLYQLGFVRALAKAGVHVTIVTPWPELYQDVPNIKFQRPHTSLRTQAKNASRVSVEVWSTESHFDRRISVHYGPGTNIADDMLKQFKAVPKWGLRSFDSPPVTDKPYIVVRPVTVRKEWLNEARNPLPEYVDQVCQWLADRYHIISVADLEDRQEWLVGEQPFAHERYHKGELSMTELFGLCQGAFGIVGGIGWIVPFAINTGVPTFIIAGGNGGYNHPGKLVNHTMKLDKIKFAVPDNFCECTNNTHNCDKRISDLRGRFDDWQSVL